MSKRRARKLGQARADLATIPDNLDTLARCLTELNGEGGRTGKVTGSAAPLRLDVHHLVNGNRKPGWHGEDPRLQKLDDRYGVTAMLESWVRVCCEEMRENRPDLTEVASARSEASVLLEVWDWIADQKWAEELAEDVTNLAGKINAALGIRTEYRPRCRYCRDVVVPVEAPSHTVTTWEACAYGLCRGCRATYPKGPALDALGQVQEPLPLKDIAALTGLPLATLYRWYVVGAISPAPEGGKRGKLFDLAAVRAVASRVYGRETRDKGGATQQDVAAC